MSLRHMVHHLKWRGGNNNIKDFPIQIEERDVYSWKEGETVMVDLTKKYQLCNRKNGWKKEVCYVVLDPEFFILVTPVKEPGEDKLVIEKKVSLQRIEAYVDTRTDQRDLILGFQ